jgi:hypothetical protein
MIIMTVIVVVGVGAVRVVIMPVSARPSVVVMGMSAVMIVGVVIVTSGRGRAVLRAVAGVAAVMVMAGRVMPVGRCGDTR